MSEYICNNKATSAIDRLKSHYGLSSRAEVLRRALTLLNVAKENEQEDGSSVIFNKTQQPTRVIIR